MKKLIVFLLVLPAISFAQENDFKLEDLNRKNYIDFIRKPHGIETFKNLTKGLGKKELYKFIGRPKSKRSSNESINLRYKEYVYSNKVSFSTYRLIVVIDKSEKVIDIKTERSRGNKVL